MCQENARRHVVQQNTPMRREGRSPLNWRFVWMQLYIHHLDRCPSYNVRRQVRVCEYHFHANIDWQNPRELSSLADVWLRTHVVEVLPVHPHRRDINGRDVKQDFASGTGVESCMSMHGIRNNAPLIRALVPSSSIT